MFRWQFFRVHFQFVMANELPNAYDFFMIVCGPIPLSERMARSRCRAGDRDRRSRRPRMGLEKASNRPRLQPPNAADLGELEPSARRSG